MTSRRLRVLMVTREFPFPPYKGGLKRDHYLLKGISRNHDVTLVSRCSVEGNREDLEEARGICAKVRTVFIPPPRHIGETAARLVKPLLWGEPIKNGIQSFPAVGRLVRQELTQETYDLIQIQNTTAMHYLRYIPHDYRGAKVVDLANLETLLLARMAQMPMSLPRRLMYRIDARRMKRYERAALANFHHIFAVSDLECEKIREWLPHIPVTRLDNGIDLSVDEHEVSVPVEEREPGILFVGSMKYPPNEEAIVWFAQEIFPRVLVRVPEASLTVVGHNPSPRVLSLASQNVRVTGTVPAVEPYYERAAVAVVPLRTGGGTRLKILEAMNCGTPIVSTTLGMEGLDVRPNVDLLVADDPVNFAEQVIELLTLPARRRQLVSAARERVRQKYDWQAIGDRLDAALCETVERLEKSRRTG